MMTPDQHTIERLQARDKAVISELYDQYAAALYGVVLRIVHSEAIAEDVLQEAFVKIWRHGCNYDPSKGSVFTWMLNIARRKAIDQTRSAAFRHGGRTKGIDEQVCSLSYQPKTEQIGLNKMVESLDEKYRTIIDLVYFQGFTHVEVKDYLDIPLGTVKSRLRIGLRELRTFFEEHRISLVLFVIYAAALAAGTGV